jgi:glycosyltransferase involved in cell wall biosynthesis
MITNIPLISVILAVYNCDQYIVKTIDSILSQTLKQFEFIIINDGSTDNTLNLINQYADKRIIVINNKNNGLPFSLNLGIAQAKSKYIARIDGDDIALPDRLEIQYKFMEQTPNIAVLGTAVNYIDHQGNYIGRSFPLLKKSLINYYLKSTGSVISHPTVIMRSEALKSVGGYCPNLKTAEDYHLWCKFLRKGYEILNLPNALTNYRILSTSLSSNNPANRGNSHFFNVVMSTDNPSLALLDNLMQENLVLPKIKRELLDKNIENKIFNILRPIISKKNMERLICYFKNEILFILKLNKIRKMN